ncbi:MAG TPA: Rid family hydrolase [Clostridia bacterium]|nr:Rid family hydrolase [Clostridia bacterium]
MLRVQEKLKAGKVLWGVNMISEFRSNNCVEYFVTMELPAIGNPFSEIVNSIFEKFNILCEENDLDKQCLIYAKIFLSDISNQADLVNEYIRKNYNHTFFILVGQAPASGAKISFEAYFCKPVNNFEIKQHVKQNSVSVKHGDYVTTWGNIVPNSYEDSYEQTGKLFGDLSSEVKELGGNIKDNVLRTWFYIRDIDNNYPGMVKSRREWFEKENMTKDTHFITSTGIEGCSALASNLVQLNYISTLGVKKEQKEFLAAPEYMNPTYEYGVAFERGVKVTYGDRTHYYISGTASIDNKGNILFPNDVVKQIERVFTNIEALLVGYKASISDLKIILVYLRDYSDYQVISNYLKNRFQDSIPYIILKAPICRPGWLIEIEGIAVNDNKDDKFKAFL